MPPTVSPLISPRKVARKVSRRTGERKPGAATKSSAQPETAKATKIRAQIAELEAQLRELNAVEVPKVILPELHDSQTGRIDAQKLADFMGTPLKPLAEGLGFNYKAVHRNPSATTYQVALRTVKRSLELLHEFFGKDEAIRIWLNTSHPDLEGATALETILAGKAKVVLLILENAWNGVPV